MPEYDDPPLSEAATREIDSILAEIDDPALKQEWRHKLERIFSVRADRAEKNGKVSNEAYERALRQGIEDPLDYAQRAVDLSVREAIHMKKVRSIKNWSVEADTKVANRAAESSELLSKTASQGLRRRPQDDRLYVTTIGAEEKAGRLTFSGLVAVKIEKRIPGYRLPHWEKTTPPLKLMALSVETQRRGARTINLRIGHETSLKALASPRGPVSYIQNQVRQVFRRRFADDAPEFWFVMEKDTHDRFHLHGAYEHIGHLDHGLIDDALRDAGGWAGNAGKGLSQFSKPQNDAFAWAAYCLKRVNLTASMTDRKLIASTAEVRDAARGSWDQLRDRLSRA